MSWLRDQRTASQLGNNKKGGDVLTPNQFCHLLFLLYFKLCFKDRIHVTWYQTRSLFWVTYWYQSHIVFIQLKYYLEYFELLEYPSASWNLLNIFHSNRIVRFEGIWSIRFWKLSLCKFSVQQWNTNIIHLIVFLDAHHLLHWKELKASEKYVVREKILWYVFMSNF